MFMDTMELYRNFMISTIRKTSNKNRNRDEQRRTTFRRFLVLESFILYFVFRICISKVYTKQQSTNHNISFGLYRCYIFSTTSNKNHIHSDTTFKSFCFNLFYSRKRNGKITAIQAKQHLYKQLGNFNIFQWHIADFLILPLGNDY